MKKIKFNEFESPSFLYTNGFFSQWCCKCGNRHIWHFKIHRGDIEDEDCVELNMFQDNTGTKLRKFYVKNK